MNLPRNLLLSALSCTLFMTHPVCASIDQFKPELLVNLGATTHKTTMVHGDHVRTDFGHMGMDFKSKYFLNNYFAPYADISGHKLFGADKDIKSSRFKMGLGAYLIVNDKVDVDLEFDRERSRLITRQDTEIRDHGEIMYTFNATGSLKFAQIKNKTLRIVSGLGVSYPKERGALRIKMGEIERIGIRCLIPDIDPNKMFINNIILERHVLHSDLLKQIRYSVFVSAGKQF